ncbi:hypothetical protein BASA60_007664 [Batrachochytrium salamandrivorans]|nr:hypothetical protein BASA60_007664 [Batrachochytrium salamandrivorans]KAH9269868.1 hypothetical protein BASA83_008016 [Batrachochytrium salamandrivorans]
MRERATRRSILVNGDKSSAQSFSDASSSQQSTSDLSQDAQRLVAASAAGAKLPATSQSQFQGFNVPMASFHQHVLLQYAAMHAAVSTPTSTAAPVSSGTAAAVAAVAGTLNSSSGIRPVVLRPGFISQPSDSIPADMSAQPLLSKEALRTLMRQVDAEQKLDVDVEDVGYHFASRRLGDLLLDVANDFVQKVAQASCQLAKHRHATALELKDAQIHLDRDYDIRVPGFGEELPDITRKRKGGQRVHASRVLHIRDTIRKASIVKRSERLRAKKRN